MHFDVLFRGNTLFLTLKVTFNVKKIGLQTSHWMKNVLCICQNVLTSVYAIVQYIVREGKGL